jgi:hypothetical protein
MCAAESNPIPAIADADQKIVIDKKGLAYQDDKSLLIEWVGQRGT